MPCLLDKSTLSSSLSYVARELENLLLPAPWTPRKILEGESIVIIDISLYFNMEHTSTAGRGGLSTGVIYTGIILNHYICISDGNDSGSSNTDDAEIPSSHSPPRTIGG